MEKRIVIVSIVALILIGCLILFMAFTNKKEEKTPVEEPVKQEEEYTPANGEPIPNTERVKESLSGKVFMYGTQESEFSIKYFADKETLYTISPSEEDLGFEVITEKYKLKGDTLYLTPEDGEKYSCPISMHGNNLVMYEEVEYRNIDVPRENQYSGRIFNGPMGKIEFLDDGHLIIKGKKTTTFCEYEIIDDYLNMTEGELEFSLKFKDKGDTLIIDGEKYTEK